jgi:predicted ATP-dependent serine protease
MTARPERERETAARWSSVEDIADGPRERLHPDELERPMAAVTAPRGTGAGRPAEDPRPDLPKAETGIRGLDEITGGGLPLHRATLVCGSAGTGKTLFAMEFLVRGATLHDEPGVFVCFEEREDDLVQNMRSLGYDLAELQRADANPHPPGSGEGEA